MPQFLTFRRTSGRDLSAVRRPKPNFARQTVEAMKKAELVELAEKAGVETSGTKAELVERLTPDEPADE